MACSNAAANKKACPCTYTGCTRHGVCCECLRYHLRGNELPACCFPSETARTDERSFGAFIRIRQRAS